MSPYPRKGPGISQEWAELHPRSAIPTGMQPPHPFPLPLLPKSHRTSTDSREGRQEEPPALQALSSPSTAFPSINSQFLLTLWMTLLECPSILPTTGLSPCSCQALLSSLRSQWHGCSLDCVTHEELNQHFSPKPHLKITPRTNSRHRTRPKLQLVYVTCKLGVPSWDKSGCKVSDRQNKEAWLRIFPWDEPPGCGTQL